MLIHKFYVFLQVFVLILILKYQFNCFTFHLLILRIICKSYIYLSRLKIIPRKWDVIMLKCIFRWLIHIYSLSHINHTTYHRFHFPTTTVISRWWRWSRTWWNYTACHAIPEWNCSPPTYRYSMHGSLI